MKRLFPFLFVLLSLLLPVSALAEQVVWQNAVNVSISGGSLTKTNSGSTWTSGASSANVIRDGYGFMEFTAPNTSTYRIAGLSYGDTNQDYTDIDYAIMIRSDASVAVYEGGTSRGNFGSYTTNDVFRVEVRYGVVRYLKNGSLFYTSGVAARYPLRVDASIRDLNGVISNVFIGNLVWTGGSGVSVSGETLTKTGSAGWNAGAVSTNTIESGDGFAEFTATETTTSRIAGLANGDTDLTDTDIEFGIELRSDGYAEIFESGTSKGTVGAYLAGDRFRVEVTSGVVRYYRNGSTLYTSGATPSYPLRVDSSLDTVGATLTDVTLEALVWANSSNVALAGVKLTKTTSDGWDATASSSRTIAELDGWMEFTAIETNTRRVAGLMAAGSASDYTDIDFAIELGSSGSITVWELGSSQGTFGSYVSGDRLRVEIQDSVVRYLKNGAVLYTSATEPSYPLHAEATLYTNGATLADTAMGMVVWRNVVGVTLLGNTLHKTNTNNAWSTAGASSTKAINSGSVEWVAFETAATRQTGLGHTDLNQNYTDIDFSIIQRNTGTIAIYESGTLKSEEGSYASGDRFKVNVTSGVVTYYRNGTLIYTSTVTPTLPLSVDAAFYDTRSTMFHVAVNGEAVTQQLEAPTTSPAGGTYTAVQTITLSHPAWVTGVTIRYTTDGSTPTTSSTLYAAPFTVDQSMTIKAKAWKNTFLASDVSTAAYTLRVPNPSMSPGAGTYNNAQTVTLSSSLSGTTIRYTTDGSDPTSSSTLYSNPLTVDMPQTLKARAFKSAWTDSNVASAAYTLKVAAPAFSPVAGFYSGAQTVTVTTATSGATLRYTLDGSLPAESSPVVPGGGVVVDQSTTLKVQGFRSGWTASDVTMGVYWINLGTVATPTLSPTPGTFTSPQLVTISTTTSGATIRYTTDGIDPSYVSRLYSGPIAADTTTQVKAKAFKTDWVASGTASGLYTIDLGTVDTPRLSPGSGIYPTYRTVTVTTETSGATIHYTTDGDDPTESDPTVASGSTVTVDKSMTFKVRAWKSGVPESSVARGDYELTGALAGGGWHSLAVKADGSVWAWGSNANGQVGIPPAGGNKTTPSSVTGVSDGIAVAGGNDHTLALKRDGTVWAWGKNANGQLGNGNTTQQNSPVQVISLTNVVGIAAGQFHSVALKNDGTVWIWGYTGVTYGSTPVAMSNLKGITKIAATFNHTFALQTDGQGAGTLWVWGTNELEGQASSLGDGTLSSRTTPVKVAGLSNVIDIQAGWEHAYAILSDQTAWHWGRNNLGQFGDGGATSQLAPVLSRAQTTSALPTRISVGQDYTLVLHQLSTNIGTRIEAWGLNTLGALGRGPGGNTYYVYPVATLMADARTLVASPNGDHVLAVDLDGAVWSWGGNGNGQMGDGTTSSSWTPAAISGFTIADNSWLSSDTDGDGMPAWLEMELGTDPGNSDTNGDGISDNAAIRSGISATDPDMDDDGVTNRKEKELGTDPFGSDSDGDSVSDQADCFPLDKDRNQCPAPGQGDTTPPTITLIEPTNATPVSTNP